MLNLNFEELKKELNKLGIPGYIPEQIFVWIHQKGVLDFNKMTNLSLELRSRLSSLYTITTLKIKTFKQSKDGTTKYLFELNDKNIIESVFIPSLQKRTTLCLSTQVGCKFNCLFCASGKNGFVRNLSVAEIVNQILFIKNHQAVEKITNIVFMGIGEPFDNFENVINAIKIINHEKGLNIGARKITISTCGLVPYIEKLASVPLQVNLAISLHAPTDKQRDLIMPVNKKYAIASLINACKNYFAKTNRQVTFEYIMIKDLNDTPQDAEKLGMLLKGSCFKVNLINYNSTEKTSYSPSTKENINQFITILEKHNIPATLRMSRGSDIAGACGQLKAQL